MMDDVPKITQEPKNPKKFDLMQNQPCITLNYCIIYFYLFFIQGIKTNKILHIC